jgi:hypothetical protein
LRYQRRYQKKALDLIGKTFGRLKVIKRVPKPKHVKKKQIYWECICECGQKSIVCTANLKNGNSKSCGCLCMERLNGIHYTERDIELDVFRPILAAIKTRARGYKNHRKIFLDLSLCELKEVWEKQRGICVYTGMRLLLPSWSDRKRGGQMNLASVDRIDSARGYTKDNIQYVCLMANYAKNCFSHTDMLYFCKCIKDNFNNE